uniref:(northern house mosquito) hypothetical protein n=1 Tax=Culex pipiens TaxID=7175 RepID=A0A8D8BTA7_CULPI
MARFVCSVLLEAHINRTVIIKIARKNPNHLLNVYRHIDHLPNDTIVAQSMTQTTNHQKDETGRNQPLADHIQFGKTRWYRRVNKSVAFGQGWDLSTIQAAVAGLAHHETFG